MTRAIEDTTPEIQARWRNWLFNQALPLWSHEGFDHERGLFHERLDWASRPVPMQALRLMVQARQISTFCRAALDGVHDAGVQALNCLIPSDASITEPMTNPAGSFQLPRRIALRRQSAIFTPTLSFFSPMAGPYATPTARKIGPWRAGLRQISI